jgi:hypothetical protein
MVDNNEALLEGNQQLKLDLAIANDKAEAAERELSQQAIHAADAIAIAVTSRRQEIVRLKREVRAPLIVCCMDVHLMLSTITKHNLLVNPPPRFFFINPKKTIKKKKT